MSARRQALVLAASRPQDPVARHAGQSHKALVRIAGVPMEATLRYIFPLVIAMLVVLGLVVVFPELALWLPRVLGY